jgi:hypothetical protein
MSNISINATFNDVGGCTRIFSLYGITAVWILAAFSISYSYKQTAGLLGRGSARRKVATYTHSNTTQNKRTQTSKSGVGFEPTIPVLKRAKTGHASDRATAVIEGQLYTSVITA